jgi:acyl-CoA reductase-like NAD-dependent aldehyde dehydrogenase
LLSCPSILYVQAQVRFLARGFSVPGDHMGQQSHGYRWPYGPVTLITPFNFPLEIPVLQVSAGPADGVCLEVVWMRLCLR